MKFSLCIDAVLKEEADFYDRIQIAKDLGYDAVEFWDPATKDVAKIAQMSALIEPGDPVLQGVIQETAVIV